jgi:hypothetical protein
MSRLNRSTTPMECEYCGAEFFPIVRTPTDSKRGRFCSRVCHCRDLVRSRWTLTVENRFWSKIDRAGSCWVWTGTLHKCGYGVLVVTRKAVLAHVFAFRMLIGAVPPGLQIDHLCRNRRCVNPAHMEAVTQAENIRRGIGPSAIFARATHCIAGHEFIQANTYRVKTARGNNARRCRACHARRSREAQQRQRETKDRAHLDPSIPDNTKSEYQGPP